MLHREVSASHTPLEVQMKRVLPFIFAMGLVALGCSPAPPPPDLPDAGCYAAFFGSGSIEFTGEEPTPSMPHNIIGYPEDLFYTCAPGQPSFEYSGVNAVGELEAWVACNEQVGPTLYPPQVTAATYFHVGPEFSNIWICFPT